MKLHLLLVLAVAALVPSLSDSRIVSVCELKDKLDNAIPQNGKHQRHHDVNLAKIICELKRMSNLNTSLVIVEGNRQPKTTNQPMTSPGAAGGTNGPAGTFVTATPGANNSTSAAGAAATAAAGTAATAAATPTDNSTAAAATGAVSTATSSVNGSALVSTNATAPSGIIRRKRSLDDHKSEDEENHGDDTEENEKDEDSSKEQGDSSDDDDDDSEEGNYGIFQLTDSHSCDSGYRWSRNKCHTDCSAFMDDDITDDIDCFVGQGYWRSFLDDVSDQCLYPGNIFSQCN